MTPRALLQQLARDAMRERGFEPEFPPAAMAQAQAAPDTVAAPAPRRDLRHLLWCSIDNDDSRDLDQLSVSVPSRDGQVRILVAIADVDASVSADSPVDEHARVNTTSVYTVARIFPMLPQRFSTDLTSLNEHEDRLAVVIEFTAAPDGSILQSDVYGALVRNQAKLAYNAVDAWLTGHGPLPPAAAAVAGLDAQLRMQDRVAQALDEVRHQRGALQFQNLEVRSTFDGDTVSDLYVETPNRAKSLIENLMVAANGIVARGARLHLAAAVTCLGWRCGAVTIGGSFAGERFTARAKRAIVTLPLGVLQAGEVGFFPAIDKQAALGKLASGPVIRVALRFSEAFWEERQAAALSA